MDEAMLKAVQRLKELIGKEPTTYPEDIIGINSLIMLLLHLQKRRDRSRRRPIARLSWRRCRCMNCKSSVGKNTKKRWNAERRPVRLVLLIDSANVVPSRR
jgi:hypothetical protein